MRQKFSTARTATVTISHGDESLEFTLTAPAAGRWSYLRSIFTPPMVWVTDKNGKRQTEKDDPDYDNLWGYLWLAAAMEPSGDLEIHFPPKATRKSLMGYALAVREEFAEAHISDADVLVLLTAMAEMSKEAEGGEGNG